MTKEESKQRIEQLVRKFEGMPDYLKRDYNEEQTKKNLIEPLFDALGWDTRSDEVQAEESASGGRVDYAFKLNGVTKFYVEAKPIRANLEEKKYHDQLVEYAYNKDVNWGVLTDFEELKIFNALEETPSPISFSFRDYVKDFDILWLLSKDSFQTDEIDKLAERLGLKTQPAPPVAKQLAEDLIKWRDGLTTYIRKWHTARSEDQVNEDVQKFLDRLIFIRVAEDRGLEDSHLLPLVHDYKEERKTDLTAELNKIFREFDKKYDSTLFRKHSSEDLDLSGVADNITKIIKSTYTTPSGKRYNFSFIGADILGEVYQQYIGTVQSGEDKNSARKKHGIYYTPRYIVDYIVENTLEILLNQVTSRKELENIKILDPAVGSGSFLVKSFEVLEKVYEKADFPEDKRGEAILKNNLFGVDLDPQAAEIAQLNILLVSAKKREILPMLDENIKVGNSLISGDVKKLQPYFGKDWAKKRPFNWDGEFSEIFANGGFDIVIGNPPWGAEISKEEKAYFRENYESAENIIDTFALFIERASGLLKDGGYLGFVLPDIVLLKNYPSIRKYILDRFIITHAVHSGMVFKGVNLDSVILLLKKEADPKARADNITKIVRNVKDFENRQWEESTIKQEIFETTEKYKFNLYLTEGKMALKDRLDAISLPLSAVGESHEGIHSGNVRSKLFVDKKMLPSSKPLIFKGDEVLPFTILWGRNYVNYDPSLIDKDGGEYANLAKEEYFEKPKILIRRTGDRIIAALDKEKYYASNNLFVFQNTKESEYSLEFLTSLLNSKLLTWYFLTIQPRKGKLFAELKIEHLNKLPVKKIDFSNKEERNLHDQLVSSAVEISKLREKAQNTVRDSNEWRKLSSLMEKLEDTANLLVYKLYGLTPEEIKIVEESSK